MRYIILIAFLLLACLGGYSQNKVGVNTDDPQFTLDVRGTDPDDGGILNLSNSDQSQRILIFPGRSGDPLPFILWKSSSPLRFVTDSSGFHEWMRITKDGNIGINDQDPLEKLSVNGNISLTDTIKFDTVKTFYRYYPSNDFAVAKHEDEGTYTDHDYSWSNVTYFNVVELSNLIPIYFPVLCKNLDLPNGSRIKEIDVYWWDNDVTNDVGISFEVYQRPLLAEYPSYFIDSAMYSTGGGALNQMRHIVHQETLANPLVLDKLNNSYFMAMSFITLAASSSLRFYGVRIRYELSHYPFPD